MLTGYPLLIAFIISVVILLVSIIKFKINPFIAMLFTSIVTGFLVKMPINDIANTICAGFGNTLKSIGIVIGLGIIFGNILSEAGATEAIAKGLLKKTGNKNAALAVTTAGFLISIPVFLDAAFIIMMPIVKYVARATKKSIMVFVCALGVGTIVGHAIVIPTPGPLAVAANVDADIAGFLFYSIIAGLAAIIAGGWLYGKRFNRYPVYQTTEEDLENISTVKKIPTFGRSMLVLLFPIVLILLANVVTSIVAEGTLVYNIVSFIGEKDIALFLGCVFAYAFLHNYIEKDFNTVVTEAADSAGLILLITGAGGAFGNVLSTSGIGDYLVNAMGSEHFTYRIGICTERTASCITGLYNSSTCNYIVNPWKCYRSIRCITYTCRPCNLRRWNRIFTSKRFRILGNLEICRNFCIRHDKELDNRWNDSKLRGICGSYASFGDKWCSATAIPVN